MYQEYLCHYGVKGMRWGVRKNRKNLEKYTLKTKSGETITMVRNKPGLLAKNLRKVSKNIANEQDKSLLYTIYSPDNKKAGNFQAYLQSPEEFNINWVGTKEKYRGRGYSTAMIKQGEAIAKSYGRTKITAELVNNSPDIHHIVLEKFKGYKIVGRSDDPDVDSVWGGLTYVEKDLTK